MATNFTQQNISSIQLEEMRYNIKSVPFHATESEWLSISYVPKQGEIIIYDIDAEHNYLRFKTGDGLTQANNLPFSLTTLTEVQIFVNNQIGSAGHLKRVVLEAEQDLPAIENADIDTIYMKRSNSGILVGNSYDEYMVINGAWEIIGNTLINLDDYVKKEEAERTYLKDVVAGQGLKVTERNHIEIDEDCVFILYGGTSAEIL